MSSLILPASSTSSNLEIELWNIFTYYTLHGCPRDPSRLQLSHFVKLCSDSQLMDATMVSIPIQQADIYLILTSELKNKSLSKISATNVDSDFNNKLNYEEFINCLIRIAIRCYPAKDYQESMQRL